MLCTCYDNQDRICLKDLQCHRNTKLSLRLKNGVGHSVRIPRSPCGRSGARLARILASVR